MPAVVVTIGKQVRLILRNVHAPVGAVVMLRSIRGAVAGNVKSVGIVTDNGTPVHTVVVELAEKILTMILRNDVFALEVVTEKTRVTKVVQVEKIVGVDNGNVLGDQVDVTVSVVNQVDLYDVVDNPVSQELKESLPCLV